MTQNKCIYDPLIELMNYYSDRKTGIKDDSQKEKLSVEEKLKSRIIDGDKIGIDKDLTEALKKYPALDIINTILLDGMKVVGELFGSGQMQLPFVLQSAECMKTAVNFLEPFMERTGSDTSKGIIILATVKGDVHDIGKNLVDIILTNNGYKVINLGIKCPVETMLTAFEEHKADAIGMSGLLVKSTAIMKDNLEVINARGLKIPVILGGAALTRKFVEGDLRKLYIDVVFYANDAFDGLKFMADIVNYRNSGIKPELEIYTDNRDKLITKEKDINNSIKPANLKSKIGKDNPVPEAPFLGSKIIENINIDKVFEYINEVALFRGSWNVYKGKKTEEEYKALLNEEIIPKFKELKLQIKREKLLSPSVIYGYYPAQSDGEDLVIYKPEKIENIYDIWEKKHYSTDELEEWQRFTFPRQKSGKNLCISDYYKDINSGIIDIAAFQFVTVGNKATEYSQKLYTENKYQDYLYFHGLSVETAEALAEYWHKIIRMELNISDKDSNDLKKLFQQGYQGSRYSFGYPACPNLEDNKILFDILRPERIGITLTEEWQMVPEQTTNAIIVHHPEAKYFFIK